MPKKIGLIDEWDRKILSELDLNARQADSEIAKKIKTSKQVVNYRIKQMIDNKIISNFYTIVDISNFDLNSYYIFVQLENLNKQEENKLISKIKNLNYVGWLADGTGRWDLIIGLNVGLITDFEKYLNEIIMIFGNHLHEYIFTTLIGAEHLGYKFLPNFTLKQSIKQGKKKKIILDEQDKKILLIISQNARLPITEISEITKIPIHVVNYRIKNMIKNGTIEGFRPKLNIEKLGYQWYLLLLQFQKLTKKRKEEFMEFCKQHKKIYYITNTIGNYNIMLDVHVNNIEEFKDVLFDLKDKFSDIIKLYENFIVFEECKVDYLPKSVL